MEDLTAREWRALSNLLMQSINWDETSQGREFWQQVWQKVDEEASWAEQAEGNE